MPTVLADYHVHTRFSCDSETLMSAACEAAITQGIAEVAFTDHLDFGPADPPGYFRPLEYLAAIEQCRARYADRLTIRAGIEAGEPHLFPSETQAILSVGPFDYVIGSAHYADGMQPAWKRPFFEQPMRRACEAYFQQVVRLAADGEFDILGHLDLIKRDARKYHLPYDGPGPYADLIRTALRSLVERGKGLEINTSPLRRGQPEPCPSLEILQWYRELGGEILTFGSDAHTARDIGADFDVALAIAQAAGFDRLATFECRQIRWMEVI